MINKKIATKLMIGLYSIVILFHFCVLFEIVPYHLVWAGRLNSVEEMYVFEAISIAINFLLIVVLSIKLQNIIKNKTNGIINGTIWVFVFLFALNTLCNLFAESWIERILGTLLTLISFVLCWVIVKKSKAVC